MPSFLQVKDQSFYTWHENLLLSKKIPESIRNLFWTQFLDAVEEELSLLIRKVETKTTLFDIQRMPDHRVLEMLKELKVPYDAAVEEDIPNFLRSYLGGLGYFIYWKSTAKVYPTIFAEILRRGNFYLGVKKSSGDLFPFARNLLQQAIPASKDLIFLIPYEEYTNFFSTQIFLDDARYLDEDPPWILDNFYAYTNSNNVFFEVFLDRAQVTLDSQEFLLKEKYFYYMKNALEFLKSATDVFLVGAQLTCMLDNSQVIDYSGGPYTNSPTRLSGCTTLDFDVTARDVSLIVGAGRLTTLPTVANPPTSSIPQLNIPRCKSNIQPEMIHENLDHICYTGTVAGKLNNLESLGTGNGTDKTFSYTCQFFPIEKKTVRIRYFNSTWREVQDDGLGFLVGDGHGTINYATGQITLICEKKISINNFVIGTGDGTTVTFSGTTGTPVHPVSFRVVYQAGGKKQILQDDGLGGILGVHLVSGTINYTTGSFTFTLNHAPDATTQILGSWHYFEDLPPENGTPIPFYYFSETPYEITEAGLWNNQNNTLMAYATFPPVQVFDKAFHLTVNFVIDKTIGPVPSWSILWP